MMRSRSSRSSLHVAAGILAAAFGAAACAQTGLPDTAPPAEAKPAAPYEPKVGQAGKDVIWVPTSQALVDRMLDMAGLTPQDRLVDLGSGDGRTVITAARRGANARGIEFNPDMVAISREAAKAEQLAGRATFAQGDIFESDFSDATVVTLFLLPDLNLRLRPTLLDMAPGTRVVSNSFDMAEWKPDETARVTDGCTGFCNAYKWIVPAKVAGTWSMDGRQLELKQTFQMLEGALRDRGSEVPISDARMDGSQIRFSVGGDRYTGQVDGHRMRGVVNGSQAWRATLSERREAAR
jgi:SAM-dependent methyltransferase